MQNESPKISIVLPVYNEEGSLEMLYGQIEKACGQANIDYKVIFVDDGSTDNSLDVMKKLREKDNRVIYISLSRNFGHQNAIFAGMTYAKADAIITMDADLQHPPSLIPQMVDAWRKGNEVVYTTKEEENLGFAWRLTMKAFYWVFSKLSGMKLNFGQSDFRLLDKKAAKAILDMPEYHKFLRGQVEWIGFKQTGLSYKVGLRRSGKSKFSYIKRFPIALNGIFGFSKNPLRLIVSFSMFVAFVSFTYMCYAVLVWGGVKLKIFTDIFIPPGWATIAVGIFFLGSVQLVAIGILGEYISRAFEQTKSRPVFIAKEIAL